MPLSLTDHRLAPVMAAAGPLDPDKRIVLMERIVASLKRQGLRRPTDAEIEWHRLKCSRTAARGLLRAFERSRLGRALHQAAHVACGYEPMGRGFCRRDRRQYQDGAA